MVSAHACGTTAVAPALAARLGQGVNTVRRRLREFYRPAARKVGRGRTELDATARCAPPVRWITAGWADRRIAPALDVTNPGGAFCILAFAVVHRGCSIPIACAVLPAGVGVPHGLLTVCQGCDDSKLAGATYPSDECNRTRL